MAVCFIPCRCCFIGRSISVTRSGSVVRIFRRISIETNDQILTGGVVAQNHAHLCLAPVAVIVIGVLRNNHCNQLHCSVGSCTAPACPTRHPECALIGAVLAYIRICPFPVACNFAVQSCCTRFSIAPAKRCINFAPLTIASCEEIIHKALILVILGSQIQETSCPSLIIFISIRSIKTVCTVCCTLIILCGELVQCLCILQVFCIAEVQVIYCQSCCIFCCNIACTIACPECLTTTLNGFLCFRRTPVAVVIAAAAFANLIAEFRNRVTAQNSAVLEVLAEPIGDFFQVCSLTQRIICILEFIVAPAQCCCGITSRQTKLYVVTCIVETANDFIASVAIATPVKCRSRIYIIAAHISIIEIHGILQQFCVVVRVRRMNRQIGQAAQHAA